MDNFLDLIYLGSKKDYDEVRNTIKDRFEAAKIEDASDDIHPYRLQVILPTEKEDEFRVFSILQGFFGCCFTSQLMMMEPKDYDNVKRWIEMAKKEKES